METAGAAPAPAAEAAAAPAADPIETAATAYRARMEAADAAGKAGAGAGVATPGTPGSTTTDGSAPPASKPRPRPADISALAQREWAAKQREERATALEGKFKPLDAALGGEKKDLRAALTTMAEKYGVEFKDFLALLTEAEPPAPTAAETAEEVVARKLAERDEAAAKAQQEAQAAQFAAQVQAFREGMQTMAEAGAQDAPDRWELTAIAGKAGEAWDIISGHHAATCVFDAQGRLVRDGEKLTREQALDLIEAKLVQKRDARRPKQETSPGAGGQDRRNEAGAGQVNDGRAVVPSFTNRATSGMPAVVGANHVDDGTLPEFEAISRAAARANIRL